jgi:hypothetical protein
VEYFGACWETKAVPALTNERVLDFARFLGGDGAKEYFQAIRETKAVDALTDPKLFQSVTALGALVAHDFFRAIRVTRSVSALTDDRVLVFAESIGRGTAAEYFRVVGSTKAVGALTSEKLFQTSGIIRSIGRDAALDYFLATANLKSAPSTGPSETRDPVAGADTAVPVLTLLDIPTYAGYRYAGLLAVSSIFWTYIWQFSGFGIGSVSGPLGIGVLIAAWAVVLVGAYLVSGSIAERSTREFLQRRRRLLNEHGIRWHDCRASDSRCPVCWTTERTHADLKFDYERFCRCTAC